MSDLTYCFDTSDSELEVCFELDLCDVEIVDLTDDLGPGFDSLVAALGEF